MDIIETITMAVALGTDAFSVAIVIGIQQFKPRDILKISLIIAIFHVIMPFIGIYGGQFMERIISSLAGSNGRLDMIINLLGSGLLMLIGFYMVIERWLGREEEIADLKVSGWGLNVLAFSVSLDSLSVGISLGMLDNVSFYTPLIFGLFAGLMMAAGLYFGSKIGHWLGEHAQMVGGLTLIYLGGHFAGFL